MRILTECILRGTLQQLEELLPQVPDINIVDHYGYTPLIETAISEKLAMAKLLLAHGANPNELDLTGGSALHWAVENHNLPLCELLLSHGADANSYNLAGQPVMVKPLLRGQNDLKKLLRQHGAKLAFAYDYINAKLIGHRFELRGSIDIETAAGLFTEVDFEGFYLEFSLDLIYYSLFEYKRSFVAKHFRPVFDKITIILAALKRATQLVKYQQYRIDLSKHRSHINELLKQETAIIPVSQEGHALTLVRHGNLLAICDRAADQAKETDSLVVYYMNRPARFTPEFLTKLIYEKQPVDLFHEMMPKELGLHQVDQLDIPAQITGNCSWANVEATVPMLFYMLSFNDPEEQHETPGHKAQTDLFYRQWQAWDQQRALQFCLKGFKGANEKQKASKAAILGAILFQRCSVTDSFDRQRAKKILKILMKKEYRYVVDSYITTFYNYKRTKAGENFKRLVDHYQDDLL